MNRKETLRKIVLMIAGICVFRNRRLLCNNQAVILCFLFCLSVTISAQRSMPDSLAYMFSRQLAVFPQEKIYMHTDKPVYITGERIWFRAHLVDAATHTPFPVSRYVYAELYDPLNTLISRIKIRNDDGVYHGHMDIPQDIPKGDYVLRAYTNFMLNLDEHYLCTKTISIGNPDNRMLRVDTRFSFDTTGTVNADFSFFNYKNESFVPEDVQMSINGGKVQNLKVKDDGTTGVSFRLPANTSKRLMLLEVKNPVYNYRQFIPIPASEDDFDVSFYPEGGSLLQGIHGRVAFKALTSAGRSANIKGAMYDHLGNEKAQIKTDYMGMGSFTIIPEEGVSYHIVCTNDHQQSKRFELPPALKTGYALSVNTIKENINVLVTKSDPGDAAYLLAHTRGIVHFVAPCDEDKKIFKLYRDEFPSGVLHLVLFDSAMNPVSERLVFVNNDSQVQASYQSDRDSFSVRSLVDNRMTLTDYDGNPLSGSFSVSVTDDSALAADTAVNILTHLLLTSDLRGSIENPAAYFRQDRLSEYSLDLLMLTQGWRRYDIAAIAHGQLARPATPLELGPEITGRVKQLILDRPVEKSKVTIASTNGAYIDLAETDSAGRFSFKIDEQPDSTAFVVQALPKSGNKSLELLIDGETFPDMTYRVIAPAAEISKSSMEQYLQMADLLSRENIWSLDLPEVTVKAKKPIPASIHRATYVLDVEDNPEIDKSNMSALMLRLPWVQQKEMEEYNYRKMFLYRGITFERIILDDEINKPQVIKEFEEQIFVFDNIVAENVTQIYISEMFMGTRHINFTRTFDGSEDGSDYENVHGLPRHSLSSVPIVHLLIMCKDLNTIYGEMERFHIKTVQQLGYQQPVEFYSPKYETLEQQSSAIPDYRTTLFWKPDLLVSEDGEASFDFYTADFKTTYSMIIEGITNDGQPVRLTEKIRVE